jgi:hypothetical protein
VYLSHRAYLRRCICTVYLYTYNTYIYTVMQTDLLRSFSSSRFLLSPYSSSYLTLPLTASLPSPSTLRLKRIRVAQLHKSCVETLRPLTTSAVRKRKRRTARPLNRPLSSQSSRSAPCHISKYLNPYGREHQVVPMGLASFMHHILCFAASTLWK